MLHINFSRHDFISRAGRAADRLARAYYQQIKRTLLSPFDIFRVNRQVWSDILFVNGQPGRWTRIDRERFERRRLATEEAEAALNEARSQEAAAYSLVRETGPALKKLLWAISNICVGIVLVIYAAVAASQPDSVLLENAINLASPGEPPPSITDERIFLLQLLGLGVVIFLWGLYRLREWLRPPPTE